VDFVEFVKTRPREKVEIKQSSNQNKNFQKNWRGPQKYVFL